MTGFFVYLLSALYFRNTASVRGRHGGEAALVMNAAATRVYIFWRLTSAASRRTAAARRVNISTRLSLFSGTAELRSIYSQTRSSVWRAPTSRSYLACRSVAPLFKRVTKPRLASKAPLIKVRASRAKNILERYKREVCPFLFFFLSFDCLLWVACQKKKCLPKLVNVAFSSLRPRDHHHMLHRSFSLVPAPPSRLNVQLSSSHASATLQRSPSTMHIGGTWLMNLHSACSGSLGGKVPQPLRCT